MLRGITHSRSISGGLCLVLLIHTVTLVSILGFFFKFKVMTQLSEELSHSNRSETASLFEGVQLETVSYAQFKVFE